ncbi:MAG: hypothetical protein RMK01_01005 [Thermomicrobium sp.]|nr:hypothetical protein [Thermomicrobium sp.]MDW8058633.1 hypothetical protein [Thermomicrobium sp.]
MRYRSAIVTVAILVASLVVVPRGVANGGQVRIADAPVGPYQVTVFTSPVPLRTGTVDVSVLLQRADTKEIVDGAEIVVNAEPIDGGPALRYPATREQATNKLYYAAEFTIDRPGEYRFRIEIRGPEGAGTVEFPATVERASSGFWRSWWFWAIVGAALVALVWWIFGGAPSQQRGSVAQRRSEARRR